MNLQNIIFLSLSVILPMLLIISPLRDFKKNSSQNGFKAFFKLYSWEFLAIISLIIGFIVRTVGIGQFPMGFNQDEASLGYDAWAILNYGIDRNGIQIPVHLIAWGSGQNALYAYICMPFIRLFGLTEFAIRLPMALIGCFSLIVLRKLLKTIGNTKLAAIGVFILAIMPWHIMKSRWGLESNIFPDLILLASLLIILGITTKRRYLYIGSAVLGLSAYAYGTSYFFIPVFLLILFIYLLIHKKILIRHALISLATVVIVSLPMILFVLINQFDWQAITTPIFTIPKLNHARQASILNLDGNIFSSIWDNIKNGTKILVLQKDTLPWNSLPFYGTHYVISLPFIIIGIFAMFRKKGFKFDFLFFTWLIVSLLMMAIMAANINRINIIYFPIIYFIILGVYTIVDSIKFSWIPIISLYAVIAVLFIFTYFGSYEETIEGYFFNGLGDAIKYSEKLNSEEIKITNKINAPYIYALFYSRTNPHDYIETVQKLNEGAAFEKITGFGNYTFSSINLSNLKTGTVYIISNSMIDTLLVIYPDADIKEFCQYITVYIK